jgi:tetratricopeptide (TPR) repeat protein
MLSFKIRLLLVTVLLAPLGAWAQSPVDQATALLDRGEYFAAERVLAPLAKAKRPDAGTLWALSRVRTGQGQTEDGMELAERAVKTDGSQARYHAQLGAAVMAHVMGANRLNQPALLARARRAYERALALEADNAVALLGLARLFWSAPANLGGDLKQAQALAERARKVEPFKAELELGTIAAVRKNHAAALQHFEAAIALNPRDATARLSAAHVLLRLERFREARERYEEALKLDPKSDAARTGLESVEQARAAAQAKR